jgi:hypothetical protein
MEIWGNQSVTEHELPNVDHEDADHLGISE